jgi:hypothetical protein
MNYFYNLSLAQQSNVCQGRLIREVSRSHIRIYHNRQDSPGRVIGPSQRPLPNNTQHSNDADIHGPGGIWTGNPRESAYYILVSFKSSTISVAEWSKRCGL